MKMSNFDKLLRPILDLANREDVTRRSATEAMAREFKLSPSEIEQRIPSGSATFINNRSGWAMTFLTKAGLISKIAPKTYRTTDRGREFLAKYPNEITVADLETIPGWEEAWTTKKKRRQAADIGESVSLPDSKATPHEKIAKEVFALDAELRERLLTAIVDQSPAFFERLVLDVLIAMGYGGSREDAAEHLGRAGDEGIDGRINQDSLGLDQILVQAKRYRPDRPVDRKEIQAFIGSLAGQGVAKGIFITTSGFAGSAHEFVLRGSATKIILVDGEKLIDLMLRHNIGVRVVERYDIKEIDQNYFNEGE